MAALDTVRPVGVVGAGTMGAGIAQVAAVAGHPVMLLDAVEGAAERAVDGVRGRLERLAARGRMDAAAAREAAARLSAGSAAEDLAGCALVVEAVVEDLEAKRTLFAELEGVVAPDTLLATNTSSLSVTALGAALERPERFLGLHFFNPAPVMALVEVVTGAATDEAAVEVAVETMRRWSKEPVRCASTPGFIVNRVARPFYGEAHRLLEERATDAATLDALVREAGSFRMGPLELTDLVGQDVNLAVSRSVWEQTFHDPRYQPSGVQQALVDAGRLGRKTGRGVYEYDGDGRAEDRPATERVRPAPAWVVDEGGFVALDGLLDRIRKAGIAVREPQVEPEPAYRGRHADPDPVAAPRAFPGGGLVLPSGGRLMETDGETATARSFAEPHVLVDWMLDAAEGTRVAVAAAAGCPPQVLDEAIGLLQATGLAVSIVDDTPGLVVARTVAMLVNEAHDVVQRGTTTAEDVDTAMRLGTGYPLGPIAWGERIGAPLVVSVLDALHHAWPTGRYRVSSRLRRLALAEEAARVAGEATDGTGLGWPGVGEAW